MAKDLSDIGPVYYRKFSKQGHINRFAHTADCPDAGNRDEWYWYCEANAQIAADMGYPPHRCIRVGPTYV